MIVQALDGRKLGPPALRTRQDVGLIVCASVKEFGFLPETRCSALSWKRAVLASRSYNRRNGGNRRHFMDRFMLQKQI